MSVRHHLAQLADLLFGWLWPASAVQRAHTIYGSVGVDPSTSAAPPAAEDDPAGVPPSPAGPPLFVDWGTPVIREVLAAHRTHHADGDVIRCRAVWNAHFHATFETWQAWREHVAPLIAERLQTAWAAEQRRQAAAGLKAGEAICSHCDGRIRIEDEDDLYHVESGLWRCTGGDTFASPK